MTLFLFRFLSMLLFSLLLVSWHVFGDWPGFPFWYVPTEAPLQRHFERLQQPIGLFQHLLVFFTGTGVYQSLHTHTYRMWTNTFNTQTHSPHEQTHNWTHTHTHVCTHTKYTYILLCCIYTVTVHKSNILHKDFPPMLAYNMYTVPCNTYMHACNYKVYAKSHTHTHTRIYPHPHSNSPTH